MKRKRKIGLAAIAVLAASLAAGAWLLAPGAPAAAEITVYKSPWCGCCGNWVKHLRRNGFTVSVEEREDMDPIKERFSVPGTLQSCHTAVVDGYIVEGHVPAADINRLLAERPEARGLSVPGMVAGSPGMEGGGRRDAYQVILFGDNGRSVYANH